LGLLRGQAFVKFRDFSFAGSAVFAELFLKRKLNEQIFDVAIAERATHI
jgi:hypothetical protein